MKNLRPWFAAGCLAVTLASTPVASAQGGPFGLGLFVGEPVGVTANIKFSEARSIALLAAWSLGKGGGFYGHADYLFYKRGLFQIEGAPFDLHFGLGAGVGAHSDGAALAVRVPVGLGHTFRSAPIEVFVELGLGAWLIPATDLSVTGGIGGRYYF